MKADIGSPTADLDKAGQSRHAFLRALGFGSNPKSCASNKLVMLGIDNPKRDVAANNVERQAQRLRTQAEGEIDLDREVDQAGMHVPFY